MSGSTCHFYILDQKKLPTATAIWNAAYCHCGNLCWIVFFVSLCSFLSNRSPRMISGKHTGDPQGAEAITPVPLQGQLCSTAVTGLETSWQPPVGPREKMSISWLGGEWLLEAGAVPKTSMWLLWSIILCRKQSWDDFHAAPCISMQFVSPCGWQQPLSNWSGNARFFQESLTLWLRTLSHQMLLIHWLWKTNGVYLVIHICF